MPAEATGVSCIAGRYATALFELADQATQLDVVADDLGVLNQMIADSNDLRRVVESPVLGRDQQAGAMDAVMEKAGLGDLSRRFIGVVAKNRRLFALGSMILAYRTLLAERRGEITAQITSAASLSESQRTDLREALKRAVGSDVAITATVDPDILGGLVVTVGSRMVDSSLRTKLQRLQLAMKGAG